MEVLLHYRNHDCAMSQMTSVWEYDNSPPSDAQCSCSAGYQECPSGELSMGTVN